MVTRGRASSRTLPGPHTAPESSTTLANAPINSGIGLQIPVPPIISSGSTDPREAEDDSESEEDQSIAAIAALSAENENLRAKLSVTAGDIDHLQQEKLNILSKYHELEARYKTLQSYKPIPKKPVTFLSAAQIQARQQRQSTAESTQRVRSC